MAILKKNNMYACGFCGKEFKRATDADSCKQGHNIMYLALTPTEINRLLNFIYTKEDSFLDQSTIERIRMLARQAVRLDSMKET